MTLDDVRAWALDNGFSRQGALLVAPYLESRVMLEFKTRVVRTSIHLGERRHEFGGFHPGRAFVNDYGVLEGIGLVSWFSTKMFQGAEAPVWFTPEYRQAILTGRSVAPAP